MIFTVSDLHGFPLVRMLNGLQALGFGEKDMLYILGDVIDRHGDGGVAILRWLLDRRNVQLLMGNHEQMMLTCTDALYGASVRSLSHDQLRAFLHWLDNGGEPTLKSFRTLDADLITRIISLVRDAPLYVSLRAAGKKFVLCHAGLGNFSPEKPLEDYTPDELLWNRPALEDRYYEDTMTVFGHTPTILYGQDMAGRIIRTPTWCDLDVNTRSHDQIAVLRLDDMREFYI